MPCLENTVMNLDYNQIFELYTTMDHDESLQIWLESASERAFARKSVEREQQTNVPTQSETHSHPQSLRDIGVTQHDFDTAWETHHKLSRRTFETLYHCFLSNYPDTSQVMEFGIDVEVLSRLFRVAQQCGHLTKNESNEYVRKITSRKSHTRRGRAIDMLESDHKLSQWPCTWETSQRRALKITAETPLAGKRVLFLGDGDFTSVALARGADAKIDVVEYDERVVERISNVASRERLDISVHLEDLRDGLPPRLYENFDIFCCDPIYTFKGIKVFIAAGWKALIKEPGTRGYLSLSHSMFGNKSIKVQEYLNTAGFMIDAILPAFNAYPTSTKIPEIKSSLALFDDPHLADIFLHRHAPFVYTSLYSLVLVDQRARCQYVRTSSEYDYMFQ